MRSIRFLLGLALAVASFGASAASAQTVSVYAGGSSQGIAVGPGEEVFFSNSVGDAVSRIPQGGGSATTYVTNQLYSPLDVFRSPTGDLYVTYDALGRVVRYTAGCVTPCTGTIYGNSSAANWTTMDPAGNLYVSSYGFGTVARFDAGCVAPCPRTTFATGLGAGSAGLVTDAAGNLYLARGNGTVLRFAAGCAAPCTPTVYASGLSSGIRGITLGEGGSFYLTDITTPSILRLPAGGGAATTYAVLPVDSLPRDLERAASGVIYVAGENAVYAVSPPAPAPVPTLTEWAMILFGLVLAGGAVMAIQRREPAVQGRSAL